MKHLLSIATFSLLLCVNTLTQAQVEVIYPDEDPVRTKELSDRPERQASVSAPDTTRLPFFEDFTDPLVPKKQVNNTVGSPVEIINYNLHGLQNGDSILIFNVLSAQYPALNDTFFVKVIDPFTFQLYDDKALGQSDSIDGNGAAITILQWAKMPYDRLSIVIPATPNPLKWMTNGGTYINDRYPIAAPSYNVATFDGLKQDGTQYNGVNFTAQGYADQLTSVPIDLSGLLPQDSLYLLFYWQCGGIGEKPETNDFMVLEVKDNTNTWVELWRTYGNSGTSFTENFSTENIPIIDPSYLYNGFQFRFRNYGRLSGPFDVWNLDYIYLNTGGEKIDTTTLDWTIANGQHTFLTNYTAMPYEHFFTDIPNQADSVLLTIANLSQQPNVFDVFVSLYDNTNGNNVFINRCPDRSLIFTNYSEDTLLGLNYALMTNPLNEPKAYNLYYKIKGQVDSALFSFGNNNYYTSQTILWNYYAYDDGTPEYAIKTVAGGVNLANRYQLSTIKDTLTAIDYCFTRNAGINMQGRTIFLTVWNHDAAGHKPGSVIHQETIDISYSDPFYAMTRYKLSTPVYLNATDTFYVGYVQNFVDPLFIGYDGSVDRSDKVYYNDGTGWTRYDTTNGAIKGSMMIRPVFDNGQILTPVVDPSSNNFTPILYPNPADDLLYIDGDIAEAQLFDLLGRPVLSYTSTQSGNAQHILNTSALPEGLYLVRIVSPEGAVKTEKLLIR